MDSRVRNLSRRRGIRRGGGAAPVARLAILLACLGDVALAALINGQAGFMPRRKMSIVGGLSSLGADEKATVAGLGLGVDESKGKELRDGSGGSREEAGGGRDAGERVVIEECSESGEAMALIPSHMMFGAGGGTKGAGLVAEIRMRGSCGEVKRKGGTPPPDAGTRGGDLPNEEDGNVYPGGRRGAEEKIQWSNEKDMSLVSSLEQSGGLAQRAGSDAGGVAQHQHQQQQQQQRVVHHHHHHHHPTSSEPGAQTRPSHKEADVESGRESEGVSETEEEVVGGGREWNRRIAERIRKVKMMGGAMHEWQVTWGEEGTIDARVCMVCDKDIGGGKEWIMANNKRHCSVACAQRSAAVFDMAKPPKDSREPTAVYLCTIT